MQLAFGFYSCASGAPDNIREIPYFQIGYIAGLSGHHRGMDDQVLNRKVESLANNTLILINLESDLASQGK